MGIAGLGVPPCGLSMSASLASSVTVFCVLYSSTSGQVDVEFIASCLAHDGFVQIDNYGTRYQADLHTASSPRQQILAEYVAGPSN